MTIVNKEEVAKYYIKCELDNIIVGDNVRLQDGLHGTNLPRLLEALSCSVVRKALCSSNQAAASRNLPSVVRLYEYKKQIG